MLRNIFIVSLQVVLALDEPKQVKFGQVNAQVNWFSPNPDADSYCLAEPLTNPSQFGFLSVHDEQGGCGMCAKVTFNGMEKLVKVVEMHHSDTKIYLDNGSYNALGLTPESKVDYIGAPCPGDFEVYTLTLEENKSTSVVKNPRYPILKADSYFGEQRHVSPTSKGIFTVSYNQSKPTSLMSDGYGKPYFDYSNATMNKVLVPGPILMRKVDDRASSSADLDTADMKVCHDSFTIEKLTEKAKEDFFANK